MKIRIRLKSCNGGYVVLCWFADYPISPEDEIVALMYTKSIERQSGFVLGQHISAGQSYIAKCMPIGGKNQESNKKFSFTSSVDLREWNEKKRNLYPR